MMTADMWIKLILCTISALVGMLWGYLMALRDNRKENVQKNYLHAGSVKGGLNFMPKQTISEKDGE